jgi:hypothetical protein
VKRQRIIIGSIAAIAVVFVTFAVLRKPEPLREGELDEVSARFVEILPSDVPPAQKAEIEGLLRRFQARAGARQVMPKDYQEVMQLMAEYLTKGSITKEELHIVMAKVGYYTYRTLTADSSAVHPLLAPVEVPTLRDTTPRHRSND